MRGSAENSNNSGVSPVFFIAKYRKVVYNVFVKYLCKHKTKSNTLSTTESTGSTVAGNKKKFFIISALIFLVIAIILVTFFNSTIRATTMRILRLEGVVTMEDNGSSRPLKENLRLRGDNFTRFQKDKQSRIISMITISIPSWMNSMPCRKLS